MRLVRLVAGCVMTSLSIVSSRVMAYGAHGHETVGAIADIELQGHAAAAHVSSLLNGVSLSDAAIWADCVKHPSLHDCTLQAPRYSALWTAFNTKTQGQNAAFHFADISIDQAAYAADPNASGPDIVVALDEAIDVLRNGESVASNQYHMTQPEALWLVAHLLGDIHQPLHIGVIAINGNVKASLGSNKFYEQHSCLHSQWDDKWVDAAMSRAHHAGDPAGYAAALAQMVPFTLNDPAEPFDRPAFWATETLHVAHDVALKDVTIGSPANGSCGFGTSPGWNITLPDDYSTSAEDQIDIQLRKAGQRLAALLIDIWPDGQPQPLAARAAPAALVAHVAAPALASLPLAVDSVPNYEVTKRALLQYKQSGAYDRDIATVAQSARLYLETRASQVQKPAVVFDIDETSLSNWPEIEANQFAYFRGNDCDLSRAGFACGGPAWERLAQAPPIGPVLDLYKTAKSLGVAVFFITGRVDDDQGLERAATEKNLTQAGYTGWNGLSLRPANFKVDKSVSEYKAPERAKIEAAGYTILVDIGDQQSDLAGGHAERTFLLPNPFYLIP